MANNADVLDEVFAALADPTRREVVRRLGAGDASVSALAADTPMALPSFLKHLRVLENSGIIRTTKKGRQRICSLRSDRLSVIDTWLTAQRHVWQQSTDRLEALVLNLEKETP